MDECEDVHSARATRRGFVLERRDGKPWDSSSVEAGAEERVVDEGPGRDVYERRGSGDGLLRWYLPHGKSLYAV